MLEPMTTATVSGPTSSDAPSAVATKSDTSTSATATTSVLVTADHDDGPLLPRLPTPDSFPFPYPQPYSIQLDLMRTVFSAIEDKKIAIVESPTGTGKSLTLLTSTLSWLEAHMARLDRAIEDDMRARFAAEDPDDPAWVIEGAVRRHMASLRAAADARAERLRRAREKEQRRRDRERKEGGAFGSRKRVRPEGSKSVDKLKTDDDLLPEDSQKDDDGPQLSDAVRKLMASLAAEEPKDEEAEEDVPKVYFASRTHSQLRQLTAELLKTKFPARLDEPGVSLVPLASRRQMCINDKVRKLGHRGESQINEACLDMQKSGAARCEFLPPKSDEGPLLDARDSVLATVRDIEDLVTEARTSKVCPYYSTRRAVKSAQLVTLPYNLLLQKNAREALGIDLTDQIVVIDEAHNLIDTILGIYSTTLPASHLLAAGSQLTQYLARFRNRLKPRHTLMIQQTLTVLRGLARVVEAYKVTAKADRAKARGEILDVNSLMSRVAGFSAGDAVNLIEVLAYLKESKLARKVSGFAEVLAEEKDDNKDKPQPNKAAARHAAIAAFHSVEAFLLCLTDSRDDGRVILSLDSDSVTIKYVLLNPSERFADVISSCRSVILAGGTMEPMSDFFTQLFPSISKDRFSTLSCAHVIPPENLLAQVVCKGPRKTDLEFKFTNRDPNLLVDLGALLQSAVGLIPDGVVVFLPSYAFLDKLKTSWGGDGGLLAKLDQRKQVFYEPQTSADVESTLRDYALAIEAPTAHKTTGKVRTGALLFAVVGGKLSEGINFSDRLGRCVVMVGLPFANVGSIELQERMRYVERTGGKDAGKELYENLCMRAVNQCIGRAIRHANDYACILLLDRRYASARIKNKLPRWINNGGIKVQDEWGEAAKSVARFFREKREKNV